MKRNSTLPEYSVELDAFHHAHRPELRKIITDLQISSNARVLDLACGDGTYGHWLAEQLKWPGIVVETDISSDYLQLARYNYQGRNEFLVARIESLPFASNSFDMVWCAQSLISLPEPLATLREIMRVLRPDGRAVILENDSLHELMLPWPEELELAIRAAEWRAYRASKKMPQKHYLGRRLSGLMRKAGMKSVSRRTYATDRTAPLSDAEHTFLKHHLKNLRDIVWPYLSSFQRDKLNQLTSPESSRYLFTHPEFEMTWFDVVCMGYKPTLEQ